MLLALLVGAAVSTAALPVRPMDRRICRAGARSRMCNDPGTGGGSTPPPLLRLLPSDGSGAPVIDFENLCSTVSSEMLGNYVCLQGDGSSSAGGSSDFAPSGVVTTSSARICPNGPDCGAIPTQSYDGIGAWTSTHAAPPAGNFSACALVRVRGVTTYPAEVLLRASSTYLQVDATGVRFRVNGGTIASVTIGAPAGRWVFACGTYRRVTNTTSVGIAYADGVAGTTVSTMPFPNALDFPVAIGTQASTDAIDIGLAFYTEKELTPATIASITTQVFGGSFTTADGTGTVTFTRNSTAHCIAPDGSLAQARINAPCITTPSGWSVPALRVEGSRTNAAIRSEEINLWTAVQSTLTADVTTGPTGALTADRVTENSAAAVEHGVNRNVTMSPGADQSFSVFLKAGTRHRFCTKTQYGYTFANLSTGAVSCQGPSSPVCRLEQYANGWWRLMVMYPGSAPTVTPVAFAVLLNNQDIANCTYTGDGTGDGFVWGAQAENASWPSSYIKTEATAATRAATLATMTLPAGIVDAQGCGGATLSSSWNQTDGVSGRVLGLGSGAERLVGLGATNSSVDISDGTSAATLAVTDTRTAPVDVQGIWNGVEKWLVSGASEGTRVAYDGSLVVSPLAIGSTSTGTDPHWGYVGNIRMGDETNACR